MDKNKLIDSIMDKYYSNSLNGTKIHLDNEEWLYFNITPFNEFITLGKGNLNIHTFSNINVCIKYLDNYY